MAMVMLLRRKERAQQIMLKVCGRATIKTFGINIFKKYMGLKMALRFPVECALGILVAIKLL
jgi:hypothetical protein